MIKGFIYGIAAQILKSLRAVFGSAEIVSDLCIVNSFIELVDCFSAFSSITGKFGNRFAPKIILISTGIAS